jgi:DNA replication licensing factor MCM2
MDGDARMQVEEQMKRRDRRAARGLGGDAMGGRRKERMPAFLVSDEEDSEDEGRLLGRRRMRRGYDEVEGDDENGFEEVSWVHSWDIPPRHIILPASSIPLRS